MAYCRFLGAHDIIVYRNLELLHVIELSDGIETLHRDASDCADHLIILKELGVNMPQFIIDALIDEYNELR